MPQITVYFPPDGTIVIRWPQGFTPDRDSLERVAQAIAEHRKSPTPCSNMEQGGTTRGGTGTMQRYRLRHQKSIGRAKNDYRIYG